MADHTPENDDLDSDLVDLSGLTLEAIAALPESVLGVALRQACDPAGEAMEVFSVGFIEDQA